MAISTRAILFTSGLISLMTPFTDTIYLPCLSDVQRELNTAPQLVALTVSCYLAAVALGQFIWAYLSDNYGRLVTFYVAMLAYEGVTVGCIFVENIVQLLILRTLQGFLAGAFISTSQGIISDVYADKERGTAMGIVFLFLLVGPIIAPLIGGYVSAVWTFRATFTCLVFLGFLVFMLTLIFVPETNVNSTFIKPVTFPHGKDDKIEHIKEPKEKTSLVVDIFLPLIFLFDTEILPYVLTTSLHFMCMFTSLVILPVYLVLSPYNLDQGFVGLCFLPVGFSMLIGSLIGGIMADKSAMRYPNCPEGRMFIPLYAQLLSGVGTILFGYTLDINKDTLGLVLFCHAILGFGQSGGMPSTMSFLSILKRENSAGACAALTFLCFGFSSISISFSINLINQYSLTSFFVVLALMGLMVNVIALVICHRKYNSINHLEVPCSEIVEIVSI